MGVLVGVGLLIIVAVTWKRANTGARIGAIIICLLVLWLCITIADPSTGTLMASGFANGFSELIYGLGHFIGKFKL